MDNKKEKKKPYGKTIIQGDYPLFNNNAYIPPWKWAALGIAACSVVILIKVIV